MRFLIIFIRAYPWQTAFMVMALLLAGILEGVGLSMILPLLSIAERNQAGATDSAAASAVNDSSALEHLATKIFSTIGMTPTIGGLLVIIVATIALKGAMMLVAKRQVGYTVARIATDLRLKLLRALLVTKWERFLMQPIGSLSNSMATETSRTSKAFQAGVMMIAFIIQAIVYACIAVLVSWKITLLALLAGFVIMYLLKHFINKARGAGKRQTKVLKSLLSLMSDTLQSIKPLKAMARENLADYLLEKKTKNLNKALQKQIFHSQALRAYQEPLLMVFLAIGLYVVLVYWRLPLATVMVLTYLTVQLMKQLNKIQERYQEMVTFESAYWSLQDTIQKVEGEPEATMGDISPSLNREIRLAQISFSYSNNWVLRNASITFPKGMITAIVGPSGAGKTTVVDLVTGLLRPQEGEVWLDDLPLAEVDIRKWRRMIGYIPQETILLHDSILNNVTLGDNELSESEAVEALHAAGAWEFVKSMPQGIHSIVGERGGMLSGGQRQRIAIARALVHKPKLLILDEATSALDPDAEAAICDTLQQLRGKLTILAISHQHALLNIADRAYRIQDGAAIEIDDLAMIGLNLEEIEHETQGKLQAASNHRESL
ncbi:MAG: ATP-binding cassette domain-containing protein [Desulfobacterales bacterium]|nr:MAG: ATP-binding cassette domain-containing protein [Desulfobacterales bacterium]